MGLPFSSSRGARIHRGCRVKTLGCPAAAWSSRPFCAPILVGSLSTRCCTDQFIRGKISDKIQRRSHRCSPSRWTRRDLQCKRRIVTYEPRQSDAKTDPTPKTLRAKLPRRRPGFVPTLRSKCGACSCRFLCEHARSFVTSTFRK
jgi:hypothetical protein